MAPIQDRGWGVGLGCLRLGSRRLGSRRLGSRGWIAAGLVGSVAGSLVACGESNQLGPLEFALVLAENFTQTELVAGEVGGFVEFDLVRQRDDVLFRDPINVLVTNQGRDQDQPIIRDAQGNQVFIQRAVAFLGNGPDLNEDGIPEPVPTTAPEPRDPLAAFTPPEGWRSQGMLAYVPNQTTIPGRVGNDRFSVYLSSMIPFSNRLQFSVRDDSGQAFATGLTVEHQPAPSQPVSIFLGNLSATPTNPVVIALCNQIGAALYMGLKAANLTTVEVPAIGSVSNSALSPAIAYTAEAYQFESSGTVVLQASGTPFVGSLNSPVEADGTATLTLVPTGPAGSDLTSCAGDRLGSLRDILPNFF